MAIFLAHPHSRGVQSEELKQPVNTASPTGLAEALALEFGASVGVFDPALPGWLARIGAAAEEFPDPSRFPGESRGGAVHVLGSEASDGLVWLTLEVPTSRGTSLRAVVGFAGFDGTTRVGWGPSCPEPALKAWGRAVLERISASGKPSGTPGSADWETPCSTPAIDSLIRHMRVSDSPERFQKLAVDAVRKEFAVEAVAWVPSSGRESVIAAGLVVGEREESYRNLVPGQLTDSVWISECPTSPGAPPQRIAAAARLSDSDQPVGWLIAINPKDPRTFETGINLLQTVSTLVANQRANSRLYGELKELLFGVIRSLTAAIDAKDTYTAGHSERVARIAVRIGEQLGLTANERGDLYLMGLIHDVGKIGIEDDVLKKDGKLTSGEYRLIQSHVEIGCHILADLKKLRHLLPGVRHHHERIDGRGYPEGLVGEQIPLAARILAVADAYDAMSSSRPYRRRLSPLQIDKIFQDGAGSQWDPKIVATLFACREDVEHIRQKGLGESLRRAVGDALDRP